MQKTNSELPGFYKKAVGERIELVRQQAGLDQEEIALLRRTGALTQEQADRMIENVIGTMPVPLGIATNFKINGKDYLIPMALEEPSVVAAASNSAKLARVSGGFKASTTEPVMIGQIQLVGIKKPEEAVVKVLSKKVEMIELANKQDPVLLKFGGGARDINTKVIETKQGKMLVVNLHVDVRDAMGANAVNTMAEAIAPELEKATGGKVRLRIITNLATERIAMASAVWAKDVIGEDTVKGVIEAYEFACKDQYRCTTHNKGIMNGLDAVVLATGNDFRAVESGAHSYAAFKTAYRPLTKYYTNEKGDLVGEIKLPLAVGLVGGATKTHPIARIAVKILGVKTARELAGVMASVGLAQNFAALRALATEGIQRGHMRLHSRNIAVMAGAQGEMIDRVAGQMVKEGKVRMDRAKEIVDGLENK